ncbi:hypothetical protein FSP39_002306 [Pinctada imbricata]|uniref:DNA primase large subunit C-terminal domain-containing protein n=1 Tax=Pinctada imbricata TaxID=66713 RepID=A0AA88XKD2_PINIB|nr:hypothetical protein FSP39_002306 [Pinctada imbricata]
MTFYIEPPTGNISLEKLETFANNRLKFLIELFGVGENSLRRGFGETFGIERLTTSDCLIEGTQKDLISHFILRICLSSDPDASVFLRHAENHLFRIRLQSFTEREMFRFLRKTEAGLQRLVDTKDSTAGRAAYDIVLRVKGDYHWKNVVKFCMMETMNPKFFIPFESALKLVAKREVTLSCGMASIPYKYLREILVQCYDDFLREEIKELSQRNSTEDVRIKCLSYKLKHILSNWMAPGPGGGVELPPLRAVDVEAESQFFPPCMKNLVDRLYSVHRLRHHARIQLTLFLKEIGMPIYEALQFWRSEYSKMSTSSEDGCHHHWQQNSRRYTYNIRHLYGLEGSKVNYKGHCCLSLQVIFLTDIQISTH